MLAAREEMPMSSTDSTASATVRVWQYPGCSTCRKALAYLRAKGVAHTAIDIVVSPPDPATLRDAWQRSGLPLRKFFNTSGQSYRQGGFGERIATMSDAEQLAALAADGKLIKRPLVVTAEHVLVGFAPEAWADAGL